jgi:hypothetical protein
MSPRKKSRTAKESRLLSIDFDGRADFLHALQHRTNFWQGLNAVWRARAWRRGTVTTISKLEVSCETLSVWFCSNRISDEWLQGVIAETLNLWERDPEGPLATLQPDFIWYAYDASCWSGSQPPERVPKEQPFQPELDEPYPICTGTRERMTALLEEIQQAPSAERAALVEEHTAYWEPLKDFENRMLNQFRRQLRTYIGGLREFGFKRNAMSWVLAEWTALAFVGDYAQLVDHERVQHIRQQGKIDSVRREIYRFAKRIGLTLKLKDFPTDGRIPP